MKRTFIKSARYVDNLPFFIPQAGISVCDETYEVTRSSDTITTCVEYIVSGYGIIEYDGKIYEPLPGNSYMLLSGKPHHYYAKSNEPWVKIWFNVIGPLPQKLSEAYGIENNVIFDCDISNHIRIIHEIIKDKSLTDSQILSQTSSCFHRIIHDFYNSVNKTEGEIFSQDALIMKTYIECNHIQPFSIEKLSSLINKSDSQINRIFKQYFNQTPYEYYIMLKIKNAIIYLETTNFSIKQIAHILGYKNEHYFSKLFKLKVGKTPSEYKQNISSNI